MNGQSYLVIACTRCSSLPCRCTAGPSFTHPMPTSADFTAEDARRLAARLVADRLEVLAADLERRAAEMRGLAATLRKGGKA